ncbi:MerR family transcriptional regulator [Actinomadura viridis]|uniref:DNA-binding transcriptional MerR regulator n=1 Tax=Actinomadura viridis TaxID=58110 RepID=A0A931DRC4_9ACTN|nr:MerR family transcriptional regulator [Actinomadura viridis]MBG6092381.1 DNA-binding transcriptional MerR regulator [Actinomadura viridis]
MNDKPVEGDGDHPPADVPAAHGDPTSSAGREYRIGELAQAAGLPVRTLRYYQERKLLPPPRRVGRIGLYSDDHLARLRVIGDLLDRGHTLEGIRELLSAWERGQDIEAVLGVEKVVTTPWSTETTVTMTRDEMAALFPGEIGPDVVERAVRLGLIEVDGDRVTHWSRRQLEATVALVRAGVPLEEVLAAGQALQRGMDEVASMFVRLISTHVLGGPAGRDLGELTDVLDRLRPGAQVAVEAAFTRAMDRQVRAELDRMLGHLAASAPASVPASAPGSVPASAPGSGPVSDSGPGSAA